MQYSYGDERFNANYLDAPYALLVKAFGNDGTVSPRDDYKCMATWYVPTPHGEVEVYDYKVGKCYDADGLERHEITHWHVQGEPEAIEHMLNLLHESGGERVS